MAATDLIVLGAGPRIWPLPTALPAADSAGDSRRRRALVMRGPTTSGRITAG